MNRKGFPSVVSSDLVFGMRKDPQDTVSNFKKKASKHNFSCEYPVVWKREEKIEIWHLRRGAQPPPFSPPEGGKNPTIDLETKGSIRGILKDPEQGEIMQQFFSNCKIVWDYAGWCNKNRVKMNKVAVVRIHARSPNCKMAWNAGPKCQNNGPSWPRIAQI